jgi:hypothetical protein
MSETAAYMALIETASPEGVLSRLQYLTKNGPHDMGWSYANILDVAHVLKRQLQKKGFFRVYLHLSNGESGVRYSMNIAHLTTYQKPELFNDPVDGRGYLVHSRMRVESITELARPRDLSEFKSVDRRKPDIRHLQLGFLFVVDPEV